MLTTQAMIKEGVTVALAEIAELNEYVSKLRSTCQHPEKTGVCGGSSGNYDPSADSYWIDWVCSDCQLRWTTDQSRENLQQLKDAR